MSEAKIIITRKPVYEDGFYTARIFVDGHEVGNLTHQAKPEPGKGAYELSLTREGDAFGFTEVWRERDGEIHAACIGETIANWVGSQLGKEVDEEVVSCLVARSYNGGTPLSFKGVNLFASKRK